MLNRLRRWFLSRRIRSLDAVIDSTVTDYLHAVGQGDRIAEHQLNLHLKQLKDRRKALAIKCRSISE